jgi:hypothetical protein
MDGWPCAPCRIRIAAIPPGQIPFRVPHGRNATVSVLFLFALARPALAARTDVIVLLNGDRITCEVKTLSQGRVEVRTDDIGTVSIEWDKIATVTTAGRFDIATRDGRRLVGAFSPAPAGQSGVGVADADGRIVTFAFLDVVSFSPVRSRFFANIDGSMDLGASYTQASGVGQASFDTTAAYRRPSFEASVTFSTSLTRNDDSVDSADSARYALNLGYKQFHANRWVSAPFVLIEHNPELGFDLRSTAAMTFGRFVVQSNRAEVMLGAGAAVGRELPVGESAMTNVDALIALSSSFYTYDYPKTSIDLAVLVFPSMNDPGRVRVNVNAKFKRELLRDFYLGMTGYNSFDNRPPGMDVNQNDVGFSLSLGWTF